MGGDLIFMTATDQETTWVKSLYNFFPIRAVNYSD